MKSKSIHHLDIIPLDPISFESLYITSDLNGGYLVEHQNRLSLTYEKEDTFTGTTKSIILKP